MKFKIKSISESVVKLFALPCDLVYKEPVITILGTHEIFVENYKCILEYTSERLLIQLKDKKLMFTGENIYIVYYTKEEMKISGKIKQIVYV